MLEIPQCRKPDNLAVRKARALRSKRGREKGFAKWRSLNRSCDLDQGILRGIIQARRVDFSSMARMRSGWSGNSYLDEGISHFYPGYPALVMATGIISNALYFTNWPRLSDALFLVNLLAYPLIMAAIIMRSILYRAAIWRDLTEPRLVFSFFTIVAASDVFGIQCDLRGYAAAAVWLWLFAALCWFFLLYLSFAVLTFLNTAQDANVVHGGWLIAIVGTQSLVLLGVRVADHLPQYTDAIIVYIHMLWGIGLILYAIFVTLFCYRIFFFKLTPGDLSPLLWVVMGAAAISANAGTSLILNKPALAFLESMKPFIDDVTMTIWAWGTWWIPLLVLFGIWKHLVCRLPLTYTPALWSMVFPLGMYSVATFRFSLASQFPLLQIIGRQFVWIALFAWAATFVAMMVSNVKVFSRDAAVNHSPDGFPRPVGATKSRL